MALAAVSVAAVGACGREIPGMSAPIPPPKLADMTSFDPCSALAPEQMSTLGLRTIAPMPASPAAQRTCEWEIPDPHESYLVEPVGGHGIAGLQTYPPGMPHFSVAGFEAITGKSFLADPARTCQIAIGVAPDQSLQVVYGYEGPPPRPDRATLCARAHRAAQMVMLTLLSRAGS